MSSIHCLKLSYKQLGISFSLKILKIKLSYDPTILLPGIYPENRKTILNWINDITQYYYGGPDEGELGYSLSNEEILDLILKNGNK